MNVKMICEVKGVRKNWKILLGRPGRGRMISQGGQEKGRGDATRAVGGLGTQLC
jgi:hypothetical protein